MIYTGLKLSKVICNGATVTRKNPQRIDVSIYSKLSNSQISFPVFSVTFNSEESFQEFETKIKDSFQVSKFVDLPSSHSEMFFLHSNFILFSILPINNFSPILFHQNKNTTELENEIKLFDEIDNGTLSNETKFMFAVYKKSLENNEGLCEDGQKILSYINNIILKDKLDNSLTIKPKHPTIKI